MACKYIPAEALLDVAAVTVGSFDEEAPGRLLGVELASSIDVEFY